MASQANKTATTRWRNKGEGEGNNPVAGSSNCRLCAQQKHPTTVGWDKSIGRAFRAGSDKIKANE